MSFVPLTATERRYMLDALGIEDVAALFDVIPASARGTPVDIGPALTEMDISLVVAELAGQNRSVERGPFFLGAGAYRHFIPSAVSAILGRGDFNTAYTPYQPEVSQGTLQATFEFQSLICDLVGMDVTNASVYDGASALAEAALMAMRVTGRERVVVSGSVHPRYRGVLETYLRARKVAIHTTSVRLDGGRIVEDPVEDAVDGDTACAIFSQPTFFGEIRNPSSTVDTAHRHGALAIEVYNPTSLGLLAPPGSWDVDIAVGEGQPLGLPLAFGGPYVGLMSCRRDLVRQMPGRIVGATTDGEVRRGFVLTLQAREQHIRREKATSNICTSQTLMALGVTVYLALLGPDGLRSVAEACHQMAVCAGDRLAEVPGVSVITQRPFFHELVIRSPRPARDVSRDLLDRGIVGGFPLGVDYPGMDDLMLICCTELTTKAHVDQLVEALTLGSLPSASRAAPASG